MYNSLKPINIYTSERLPSQIYGIARRPGGLVSSRRTGWLFQPLLSVVFLGCLTQSLVAVLLSALRVSLQQIVSAAMGLQRRSEGLGSAWGSVLGPHWPHTGTA